MCPSDGDFLYFEVKLARQKEKLRIKSPAFDFLQGENGLNGLLLECFEAALCVLEPQAQRDAQQQVEDPSEELPL